MKIFNATEEQHHGIVLNIQADYAANMRARLAQCLEQMLQTLGETQFWRCSKPHRNKRLNSCSVDPSAEHVRPQGRRSVMRTFFDYVRRSVPAMGVRYTPVADSPCRPRGALAVWAKVTYRSVSGGGTRLQPDTPIDDITHFDKRLEWRFGRTWGHLRAVRGVAFRSAVGQMSKIAYLPEDEVRVFSGSTRSRRLSR